MEIQYVRIDPSNINRCKGQIKGFLINIRNWELSQSQSTLKKDKSAPIKVLARRSESKRLFPCPVDLYELTDWYVLVFRLGEGEFLFNLIRDIEISELFEGAGSDWNQTFDPIECKVYFCFKKGQEYELHYPNSMLQRALLQNAEQEEKKLLECRKQALSNIGYFSIQIREATGKHDPKIEGVSRLNGSKIVPITARDLLNDMIRESGLIVLCPNGVENVMQRARLLYVNAYSEWEFFTMSVHYAVLALEASLRSLYDAWLGSPPHLVKAKINGKQITQTLNYKNREEILRWSNQQEARSVYVNDRRLPRTKSDLLNHAVNIKALKEWEVERCTYLLDLRDKFSHPTDVFIEWTSWARECIFESCLYINLMWSRYFGKYSEG